jgi:hypothetical protein
MLTVGEYVMARIRMRLRREAIWRRKNGGGEVIYLFEEDMDIFCGCPFVLLDFFARPREGVVVRRLVGM